MCVCIGKQTSNEKRNNKPAEKNIMNKQKIMKLINSHFKKWKNAFRGVDF